MKRQRSGNSSKSERFTITLATGQRRKIRGIARDKHISEATVIRWAVDEYVAGPKPSRKKRRP
jgi:hypothetical protein